MEVLDELVAASALPSFTSDYIMRRVENHTNRIAIPILDSEASATYYCTCRKELKNYFQGVYGKNISTWLREARMSAASAALREGNQPVAEIAASVGYENASKFSAAFKSFLGETPLEYRRQSRCGI